MDQMRLLCSALQELVTLIAWGQAFSFDSGLAYPAHAPYPERCCFPAILTMLVESAGWISSCGRIHLPSYSSAHLSSTFRPPRYSCSFGLLSTYSARAASDLLDHKPMSECPTRTLLCGGDEDPKLTGL